MWKYNVRIEYTKHSWREFDDLARRATQMHFISYDLFDDISQPSQLFCKELGMVML